MKPTYKTPTTPERSEGARYERKAIREYLRRMLKKSTSYRVMIAYKEVLDWVLLRQKRYDKKVGGLGKK